VLVAFLIYTSNISQKSLLNEQYNFIKKKGRIDMDSVDINNKLNSTWVSDELDLRILQDNFCDLSSLSKCRALMNILINEREYSSVEVNKASMKEIVNLARDDQDMVCVACGILYIISMYMKFSFNGMH
jgi:hypothetical protein